MSNKDMKFYNALVLEIIVEQETVIGPLAWDQAKSVSGLAFGPQNKIELQGEPVVLIEKLVNSFSLLFGEASVEVCRQAAERVARDFSLSKGDLPVFLQ